MAGQYKQSRRVVVEVNGQSATYDSAAEAADALGLYKNFVYAKIAVGRPDSRGRLFYYEGEKPGSVCRAAAKSSVPVVAMNENGIQSGFRSINAASVALGLPMSMTLRMLNSRSTVQGWRLYYGRRDDRGVIAIMKELYSPTELQVTSRRNSARPQPREGVLYGYYDNEYGPVVCPVCKSVMELGPDKVRAHFRKCLKGRTWKIRPDRVMEVSETVDPDMEQSSFLESIS